MIIRDFLIPLNRLPLISLFCRFALELFVVGLCIGAGWVDDAISMIRRRIERIEPVSYTHLRAHETVLDLVCRLLLEKKKTTITMTHSYPPSYLYYNSD